MADAPIQTIESQILAVLNYVWATTGNIAPDKFKIGVTWDGWVELGGTPKTASLEVQLADKKFDVVPVPGLPKGSVALIWQ